MHIGVLGSGQVGRALAGRLDSLGHQIVLGTRDPQATVSRDEYGAWAEQHVQIGTVTFAAAAAASDVVINAAGGAVAIEVLESSGETNLEGKVLIDVSNPLDPNTGMPPQLFVKDDDSLAEMIQRRFPKSRVVKTLNTVNQRVMVNPAALGDTTTVFVCGDDQEARAIVTGLLKEIGHTDVLDLGGLATARGAEMYVAFWLRVALALGTSDFNIKIVR